MSDSIKRCAWPSEDALMIAYHDQEWGVPLHDDRKLFEFMVLDAMQAGLSWRTILYKRENFRKAFANFDYVKIARFGERETERLLKDEGIIRNRLKIAAVITNAQRFLDVQKEFDTFDKYIWQFTNGQTLRHRFSTIRQLPVFTPQSDAMSRDLKLRGFKFVGSTICYAFMQAAGMVNDHTVDCFRYRQLG